MGESEGAGGGVSTGAEGRDGTLGKPDGPAAAAVGRCFSKASRASPTFLPEAFITQIKTNSTKSPEFQTKPNHTEAFRIFPSNVYGHGGSLGWGASLGGLWFPPRSLGWDPKSPPTLRLPQSSLPLQSRPSAGGSQLPDSPCGSSGYHGPSSVSVPPPPPLGPLPPG